MQRVHFADPSTAAAVARAAGAADAQTPAPAPAPAPASADLSRSLFELTDRELFIGGRVTSIDGDPARFQRYQDLRDGLLFSGARFARADAAENWFLKARANNVGWRDQGFAADYTRRPIRR